MSDLSGATTVLSSDGYPITVNANKTQETKRKPIYFNQRINSSTTEIKKVSGDTSSNISTPLMAYDKNGNIVPFNHGTSFDINDSTLGLPGTSEYQGSDKRVSLTVRPRTYNTNDISLIEGVQKILSTNSESTDGILYKALGNSFGIIFPYTPNISGFGKTVNYDTIQVPHSNLSFNQYKNTSPNELQLKAKFTADNKRNALSMISSIWFLNACSSSKFGKDDNEAGLPPPVLYLNGYNDMIDNIPVVISSFDYNLDDKSQYVRLDIKSTNLGDKVDSFISDEFDIDSYYLTYWLPTELDISIKLKIQPNVRKVYDEWSLDKYKKGDLFGSLSRSNSKYIPSGWTW